MDPSERLWSELRDLRSRLDRLSLVVVALAVLLGGTRVAELVGIIVGAQ